MPIYLLLCGNVSVAQFKFTMGGILSLFLVLLIKTENMPMFRLFMESSALILFTLKLFKLNNGILRYTCWRFVTCPMLYWCFKSLISGTVVFLKDILYSSNHFYSLKVEFDAFRSNLLHVFPY